MSPYETFADFRTRSIFYHDQINVLHFKIVILRLGLFQVFVQTPNFGFLIFIISVKTLKVPENF